MMKVSLLSSLLALTGIASATPTRKPAGFVATSGTMFTLEGKPHYISGTNSYWLPQLDADSDMVQTCQDMAAQGITVVRTWAFNEVAAVQGWGAYYALWNGTSVSYNTGAHGISRLQLAVATCGQYGIKSILTFTNNWSDYGGSDLITEQLLGSTATHDEFYTNPTVIAAYQNYARWIVSYFKNDPNVFAFELMNEPRCGGSGGLSTSAACNTTVITKWARDQSLFIKTLDPYHMVTLGDEGFFNHNNTYDYNYDGGAGIDFDANLQLPDLDFGTFHLYPVGWGEANPDSWGTQYIKDHGASSAKYNKPVIMEEFGVPTSVENKTAVYTNWYATAVEAKLAGVMPWQFGDYLASSGPTWNDGFSIYPNQTSLTDIVKAYSALCKAANLL